MFNDPIVAETRKVREQMASKYDFDVRKLGRHFIEKQERSQRVFVKIPDRKQPLPHAACRDVR